MNLKKRIENLEKQAAKNANSVIQAEDLYGYMKNTGVIDKKRFKELNSLSDTLKRNPFETLTESELRTLLVLS